MKVGIIGSGISGLAAAASLAKEGHEVHVYEKNEAFGGRLRSFEAEGYKFDMGPSWYWMPDVFEDFYKEFGRTSSDFYELKRLDPSYQVIFDEDVLKLPADLSDTFALFESEDPGSAKKLHKFLVDARYKYEQGMKRFVWKPALSFTEYLHKDIIKAGFNMNMFSSVSAEVAKITKNEKLRQILEFPVLFLGAKADNTPAMYSLMNYADFVLGTWYPMGGMNKIVEAFVSIAKEQGAHLHNNATVEKIHIGHKKVYALTVNGENETVDALISTADYHHVDREILEHSYSNYSEAYWNRKQLSPSSILYYVGLGVPLDNIQHHNLFFDANFDLHASQIYDKPKYPTSPLFYLCNPSITDDSLAPHGHSSLFFLIPIASGLEDSEEERERQFAKILKRTEKVIGFPLEPHIKFKRSYAIRDFEKDYNSYKGNAYGLANTLRQTAFLKPSMKNAFVKNLYYAGQLTNPGPGLPPSIISGQIAAKLLMNDME